jgi:hypothetical protein
MSNSTNLKPNQRMKIIRTGMEMENSGQKVTYVELSKKTNFNKRTCKLWWDRKDLLLETGTLCDRKKGRSGRPMHPSFSNKQKIDDAITVCENLGTGQHLRDAAKELKCGQRTLQRHLKNKVTWKKPPKKEKNHNNYVSAKRVNFARALLNRHGKLKYIFQNVTFLDHKKTYAYGQNWTHQRQCRRKGSTKPLRPLIVAKTNPSIHGMFVANQHGCDVYLHGQRQLRPRKRVETWIDEQVNEQSYLRGLRNCVVPLMKATNSKILMSDCVNLNHTPKIQQFLSNNKIELYGSAGYHHQVEGGYPPYSHDCSILDSSMFGTFQTQIGDEIASNTNLVDSDDILVHMSKIIPQIWKSDKYKTIAKNHIDGYAKRLQTIIDNNGDIITKYK